MVVDRLVRLAGSPQRAERLLSLAEIRLNGLRRRRTWGQHELLSHEQFVERASTEWPVLYDELTSATLRETVDRVRTAFRERTTQQPLPYPSWFNSDISFAELTLALTRAVRPANAVEVGVGYGVTSALVLAALEDVPNARLVSIDLPPLADADGRWTGMAVDPERRAAWTLLRGSSRRLLPAVLPPMGRVDLFVSDSANVASLQRFELQQVLPYLQGVAVFNNVSPKVADFLRTVAVSDVSLVRQVEKVGDVTAIIRSSAITLDVRCQGHSQARRS